MDGIWRFVDLYHIITAGLFARCLLMLVFELPRFVRFRAHGLCQTTGEHQAWLWGFDSPLLLVLGALISAGGRFWLPYQKAASCCVVIAGMLALGLAALAATRVVAAHRLHPYIAGTALVLALLSMGQQALAAGLAGLLLFAAPGYERILWSHIGVVTIWGQGSMGYAPDSEHEVLAWSLVLTGLCAWVFMIPPSFALPVWAILIAWTCVISLVVTTGLVFHTTELPPVNLPIRPVTTLQRYAVQLTLAG